MTSPLRTLITTLELNTRRGVQSFTRDLALGLLAAGHQPSIYTRKGGPVADEIRARGIPVETNIAAFGDARFDVIHGHHLVVCSPALARFPSVPALFVCHDNGLWCDAAPRLPTIVRYVAVSESLAGRVAFDAQIDRSQVALVLNGVDTQRFRPGPPPASPPRRALAFAKNKEHVAPVAAVCAQRGIAVDFIGEGVETWVDDPSQCMPGYDLVFASALSAIEAMACLRPVIVCDGRGMAGMVDMARYETWRPENFGQAVLSAPLSVERMAAEIGRFDPVEAARVGTRVREEALIDVWVGQYIALYREAITAPLPSAEASEMLWARHLERWTPQLLEHWAWTEERQTLVNEYRRTRMGLDVLPLDNRLTFSGDRAASRFVDLIGFEKRKDGMMWTTSRFASLRFHPGVIESDVEALLEYAVYLPSAKSVLRVEALCNGHKIEDWSETGGEGWVERARGVRLPREACNPATSWLALSFVHEADGSPKATPAFCLRAATFRNVH